MTPDDYEFWLRLARKHSRIEREAEDLLQAALLAAVEEGRTDLDLEANRAWLAGVIRNQGAMHARSALRRKEREEQFDASEKPADMSTGTESSEQAGSRTSEAVERLLQSMSPAARQVAVLVLHGMDRAEIRTALALPDTALRQRFTSIRRALAPLPNDLQQDAMGAAYARRRDRAATFPLGLIRRALLRHLGVYEQEEEGEDDPSPRRAVGTHDPTGHLFVLHPRDEESH